MGNRALHPCAHLTILMHMQSACPSACFLWAFRQCGSSSSSMSRTVKKKGHDIAHLPCIGVLVERVEVTTHSFAFVQHMMPAIFALLCVGWACAPCYCDWGVHVFFVGRQCTRTWCRCLCGCTWVHVIWSPCYSLLSAGFYMFVDVKAPIRSRVFTWGAHLRACAAVSVSVLRSLCSTCMGS